MTHKLKLWPQFFKPVLEGIKTFELRENDRGFQKGDIVVLKEFDPEKSDEKAYSGREMIFKIGYVLALRDGWVIFSLNKYLDENLPTK